LVGGLRPPFLILFFTPPPPPPLPPPPLRLGKYGRSSPRNGSPASSPSSSARFLRTETRISGAQFSRYFAKRPHGKMSLPPMESRSLTEALARMQSREKERQKRRASTLIQSLTRGLISRRLVGEGKPGRAGESGLDNTARVGVLLTLARDMKPPVPEEIPELPPNPPASTPRDEMNGTSPTKHPRRRSHHVDQLHEIFTDIDVKKRGYIDLRSFMEAVRKNPKIQQYLNLESEEEGFKMWKRIGKRGGRWRATYISAPPLLLSVRVRPLHLCPPPPPPPTLYPPPPIVLDLLLLLCFFLLFSAPSHPSRLRHGRRAASGRG
jgi:hypothetical protein